MHTMLHFQASYERKRIPLSELKSCAAGIGLFLSSRVNTIGNSILFCCLDDDADDALLLEYFGVPNPQEDGDKVTSSLFARTRRTLRQRMNFLRYLQDNIIHLNTTNADPATVQSHEFASDLFLRCISRVFGMTISLTVHFDGAGKVCECERRIVL